MLTVCTENARVTNARKFGQFLDGDVFEGLIELVGRQVAGDGHLQNGDVREGPGNHLRFNAGWKQAGNLVDGELHLLFGRLEARAVGERGRDLGKAVLRGRGRRLESIDALNRRFDRGGDLFFDDDRRGTRVARDNDELGERDGRNEFELEERHRDTTERRDDDGHERDKRTVFEAEIC